MTEKIYWDERWKAVHFEGIHPEEKYELSNYGRIRRMDPKSAEWKINKPANVNGYAYFSFRTITDENGKNRITKSLHRLVADLFLKYIDDDHNNVIHLDFNKWNNHVSNLRWATKKEMFEHSRKSPRTKIAIEKRKGEITNSKLTETEVIRLKKKLKRGKNPLYKIAKEFGITHTQLNRIRRGENWGHIKID
ncbi:MAG: HNH endonuclease [Bacteroidales bacterium]|nr:HNH endonuclease [Bacteroidales bacterium]